MDTKKIARYTKKIKYKDHTLLSDDICEVTQHATKIVEKYPLHCGNTVLQLSKLNLMKFVLFLYDYLVPDSFELVYSGMSYATHVPHM